MQFRTSYHNHTLWSDGKPTIAEQIAAAKLLGLEEIGISDHFTLTPESTPVKWSMPIDRIGEYVEELVQLKKSTKGIKVRIGLEADFFPSTVNKLREIVSKYPFDYIIGSVHFVDDFPIDESAQNWDSLAKFQRDEVWREYWILIRQMAESRVFDFAAHIDLPKRFGHYPINDLVKERHSALDAIAKSGMSIEMNTAGWHKPVREVYPSKLILQEIVERKIPILINSDAHETAHLIRDFDHARRIAVFNGVTQLARYEGRKRIMYPI